MKELLRLFQKGFPKEECVVPDKRQPEIFNCKKKYWCLIINDIVKNEYTVRELYPYIGIYDTEVFCGWIDESGNLYDDIKFPNANSYTVIAYKK